MNKIERTITPEEKELREKELELGRLEGILSQKELELATLASELSAFHTRYIRIVGAKFAELDRINFEIAEFLVSLSPDDTIAQEEARTAKAQADESFSAADLDQEDLKTEKFKPTQELKDLYRKLAKTIHPDLVDDDEERKRRNEVMAEVNKAYSEGDLEKLEAILEQWQSSPDQIKGEDIGAKLVRTIRMISRVKNRLSTIENELSQFTESEIQLLFQSVSDAREKGRDLLAEMAQDLNRRIEEAKNKFQNLKEEYG